jgi:hypothetical protein
MNITILSPTVTAYDEFKMFAAQYAPAADVYYIKSGANLAAIYAVDKGEPGCKGAFPFAVSTAGDLSSRGISVTGVVLVDFPNAVEVKTAVGIGG